MNDKCRQGRTRGGGRDGAWVGRGCAWMAMGGSRVGRRREWVVMGRASVRRSRTRVGNDGSMVGRNWAKEGRGRVKSRERCIGWVAIG